MILGAYRSPAAGHPAVRHCTMVALYSVSAVELGVLPSIVWRIEVPEVVVLRVTDCAEL